MLLRNRSRAVTKPALMADHSSQPSQQNYARAIPSSLFGSPKFREWTNNCVSGTEALRSPTSILNTRALNPFVNNPFSYDTTEAVSSPNKSLHSWDKIDSEGIGLALVDSLQDDQIKQQNSAKPNVLFGTQLKLKIPPFSPSKVSQFESQTSSAFFGVRTKDSLQSASGCENSGICTEDSGRVVVTGVVSLSEMELCEEYTCVKSYGHNPRTTHIFDNCIVGTYSSVSLPHNNSHSTSESNFLSFCYSCKMHLDHTKDIFIYRFAL